MTACKRFSRFPVIFLLLLSAALACNMPGVSNSEPVSNPDGTAVGNGEYSPDLSEADPGGDAPAAGRPADRGLSRSHPDPIEAEVNTPYWDFKVLEILRGQAAYELLQEQDPDAAPPPDGQEYLLVKVWVRCKNPDISAFYLDLNNLFITGDRLYGYTDRLIDLPSPEFYYTDMYTAESLEGWIDVLIDIGEQDLMLVFDREEYVNDEKQPRELRYVALEPGATLSIPPELASITPNELGKDRDVPARIGETVITADWELTVLETRRGQAALDLVLEMNDRNELPEEGLEYVAFFVRARYIGAQDVSARASNYPLRAYVPGQGRNGSDQMEDPNFYKDPSGTFPLLNAKLFPGGQAEGWVIKQVPAGYSPVIIQYLGFEETNWDDVRYFSLEP